MSFLKDRRLELGLTMLEVAKRVGVSEATISRWESGDIDNMKRDKIALLAKALEISPLLIVGLDQEDISIDQEIINLAQKIKNLPLEKRKAIKQITDAPTLHTQTIAAHRTDDPTNELPPEARKSIEDFKKFIFEKHGIKYD
jgi:transcriptional regulator with XRE-family HTH domain